MSAPTDLSINKIGDSSGDLDCFLVSLVSLALIACFLFSESMGDPPRLFGFESSLKNFCPLPNFVFTEVLALCPLSTCENHLSSHPTV